MWRYVLTYFQYVTSDHRLTSVCTAPVCTACMPQTTHVTVTMASLDNIVTPAWDVSQEYVHLQHYELVVQ
jgi:hypothetical protein